MFDDFNCACCEGFHLDEPLRRQAWLNNGITAITVADRMLMVLDLLDVALGRKIFDELLPRFKSVDTGVGSCCFIQDTVIVHDVDGFKLVAAAYLEVVRVMRRCDLDGAGAELGINKVVGNHRQFSLKYGQNETLAYEFRESTVARIDSHGCVAEHRLRTGCGHRDKGLWAAILDRVLYVVELAVFILVFALLVGERCLATGTPVDDVLATIDQALIVEPDKHLGDCITEAFVHREAFSIPVAG